MQDQFEVTVASWDAETDKAYQVTTPWGTQHWIAKSQVIERGDDSLVIPDWLARKAGIERDITAAMNLAERLGDGIELGAKG